MSLGHHLASPDAAPPTSSSYWVVPGLLLCGAYPGDQDPDERRSKTQALVVAGVQTFVNLMEEDETNYAGEPFVRMTIWLASSAPMSIASVIPSRISPCRHWRRWR